MSLREWLCWVFAEGASHRLRLLWSGFHTGFFGGGGGEEVCGAVCVGMREHTLPHKLHSGVLSGSSTGSAIDAS